MNPWRRDDIGDLAALVGAALPGEGLQSVELERCLFDDPDPTVVLGDGDGTVAVAAGIRTLAGVPFGFVRLLVVHPAVRRQGRGIAALRTAHEWLVEHGAVEVHALSSAPFYLWPGVDVRWTAALCLLEAAGYQHRGLALNMRCPTAYRADVPPGVAIVRLDAGASGPVRTWCAGTFPMWVPELDRATTLGSAFAALDETDGTPLGFACHGANREGWFGPIGTDPHRRRAGLGAALLGACCADVADLGREAMEVSWVGPVRFYAKAAGAEMSRAFVTAVWRAG